MALYDRLKVKFGIVKPGDFKGKLTKVESVQLPRHGRGHGFKSHRAYHEIKWGCEAITILF